MKTRTITIKKMVPVEQEITKYVANDGTEWDSEYLATCRDDLLINQEKYKWQDVSYDGDEYNIGYFDSKENMMNFLNSNFRHLGSVHLWDKNPKFPNWFMVNICDTDDYTSTYIYSGDELIKMIDESEKEIDNLKRIING